ncbi:hypothetical protein [Rhizobium herbae]|uniref:Uncharacterized protein n=1 Tax=Rhizobium herbae TaxID=508661 RepID=A0ABS4EMC4_9HYPH|nr:hypothetical protein [Rhizobium herbae]MBP1859080.1 hypothetical protein [Rhizobium herbae]
MPKLNALSLKTLLTVDAVTCAAMGAALLAAAVPASAITQIPQGLLQGAGLSLLPIAAFMAVTAMFALASRWAVGLVILGNLLWVAVSILLPLSGFIAPNVLGWSFLLGQAFIVAVLAKLELDASRNALSLSRA